MEPVSGGPRPGGEVPSARAPGGLPAAPPRLPWTSAALRALGLPIDENITSLVDALNRFPALDTFSSCGGHPPPLRVSQLPEGSYQVNFSIQPWDGGWYSLEHLAFVIADLEDVALKIWLSGDTPDTMAFELYGTGNPADLAALIDGSGLAGPSL